MDTPNGSPEKTTWLTALFVDFDNIYISLLSKDREAATRFATDPLGWTRSLVMGSLGSRPDGQTAEPVERRLIIARVYGNPIPHSKDRTSFSFVRSHYMHAGFEVIDCPPLTNQMKNGSDIRMVLDMRDLLEHVPPVDEFVIMSGDSDFVPILLRLRAHDRRTMIYASQQTARSYTAIADQMITEEALVACVKGRNIPAMTPADSSVPADPLAAARQEIIEEVAKLVSASDKPVPMELLATSVRNAVGLKRTIDTKWAGAGQFSLLLAQALSDEFAVTGEPPYMVWHRERHGDPEENKVKTALPTAGLDPQPNGATSSRNDSRKASVKAAIETVLKVTGIPALSARYYQRLFELIAEEIGENGFIFGLTAANTAERGKKLQLPIDAEHVQEILHRIRRHGHWFDKADNARTLARAFRDSIVKQCLEDGLTLTQTQMDLIDGWFIPPKEDEAPTDHDEHMVETVKKEMDDAEEAAGSEKVEAAE
jgi:hypothetical protein